MMENNELIQKSSKMSITRPDPMTLIHRIHGVTRFERSLSSILKTLISAINTSYASINHWHYIFLGVYAFCFSVCCPSPTCICRWTSRDEGLLGRRLQLQNGAGCLEARRDHQNGSEGCVRGGTSRTRTTSGLFGWDKSLSAVRSCRSRVGSSGKRKPKSDKR